ncbi:unnamed protein product [Sphagnum compactum]
MELLHWHLAAAGLCFYQNVLDMGVVAVKLVLEEGFFDATCPKIQEEEEACLSCQDVVLNLLSFPQVGNGAIVLGFVRSRWTFTTSYGGGERQPWTQGLGAVDLVLGVSLLSNSWSVVGYRRHAAGSICQMVAVVCLREWH